MKLAEALIWRTDLRKRTEQLRRRLKQEAEAPAELWAECERVAAEWESFVRRIQWTGATVPFDDQLRIVDAVTMRSTLDMRIRTLRIVLRVAEDRAAFQAQLDELEKKRRELDIRLQQVNWQVDLLPLPNL